MEQFITQNQKQTQGLARILAREILKYKKVYHGRSRRALVFGLIGNLGAGKTTFIQAFAKGIGIKARLTSPTFVLMKKYGNLYHIDCYRIKNYKDILVLDFQEIVFNPKNIIMIEWAERVRKILPKDTIWIKFDIVGKMSRKIKIL